MQIMVKVMRATELDLPMARPMRLLHWIDMDKLNWEYICYNKSPGALPCERIERP